MKPSLAPRPLELPSRRTLAREDGLPLMMGIVNVTPDSFSDGGKFLQADQAIEHALALRNDGADIIDLGAESSRPGAQPLSDQEEWARLSPVLEGFRKQSDVPVSIDTYHAETARRALDAGADIVNDITAGRGDLKMLPLVGERGTPICLMHMLGEPRTMQRNPRYADCAREVRLFLKQRCEHAKRLGVQAKRLIVDPGFGFGKLPADNMALIEALQALRELGLVLMGLSRKSTLVHFSGLDQATSPEKPSATIKPERDARLAESLAGALLSFQRGADILRVHDVDATIRALRVAKG